MRSEWSAVAAVLATVALLAAAACQNTDEAVPPNDFDRITSPVWAIDVGRNEDSITDSATRVGDHDEVMLPLAVYATVCTPEAHDHLASRGGYGHERCSYPYCCRGGFGAAGWSQGSVDELDQDHPELRLRELKATASVAITAEFVPYSNSGEARTQWSETLWTGEVGPLGMYEADELDPIVAKFDLNLRGSLYRDQLHGAYQIHVTISDCWLSSGSACGNNSRRFYWHPTSDIGSNEQGLGPAGAGLTIPDRAGGLGKIELGSGQEGGTTRPDQNGVVGGVPVRRIVQGLFQAGSGLGRVYFWGVEFAEPPPPEAVGSDLVGEAFGRGLSAGGNILVPSSEIQRYDAGPLGGQLWCQTFTHRLLAQTSYACGWVDRSTVGTISVSHDAINDLGLTEDEAAALLVEMRSDIETQG
jgi:hypothetical protein